ncbi:hypothetical protein PQR05_35870 [Paraburkholderia sediminicola]|uniref:hypothetical protein n=2 Tax=Paraburkholderia sediminicola TaxID=458836 RepID=UPI0038B9EBA7
MTRLVGEEQNFNRSPTLWFRPIPEVRFKHHTVSLSARSYGYARNFVGRGQRQAKTVASTFTEPEYLRIRELRCKRVTIWKWAVFKNERNPICCLVQIVWHIRLGISASSFDASIVGDLSRTVERPQLAEPSQMTTEFDPLLSSTGCHQFVRYLDERSPMPYA